MIRILMVDDHPSARDGTKARIEQEPDMCITVVGSGAEALELIEARLQYDIMLFDLNIPAISGLELTRRVMELQPGAIILIYTGYDITPNFNILIEAGISGFISKASTWEHLIQSLRYAHHGESIIPTCLLRQLRRQDIKLTAASGHDGSVELASITQKEQIILEEIAQGKSNKDIANGLFMSQRNVEYHLSRIFVKLNVNSRFEAIAEARKHGLIKDDHIL